jgi:starch phosphorylase
VYAPTWTSQPFQALYDRSIPGWREDTLSLRYALSIPLEEIWNAHMAMKRQVIQWVQQTTHVDLDVDLLTVGFARRTTAAGHN